MEIQGLYAVANVDDLPRSEDYYTKLLGRGPDDRPIEGMIQWRGFGSAGIQLFADQEKAGQSVMTIVTPDIAETQRKLAEEDIELGEIQRGPFGALAQLFDPDGNRINVAEPPKS
jgi:catechol 2,3-dioxygenase-like lactoylglutathione lyase family enzyme